MTSKRRLDIDGLRCIAVLSVVIYHLKEKLMPAGYLGVDIFFFISGYVVMRSAYLSQSDYSWSYCQEFYMKRVKRLMPALFAVISATVVFFAIFIQKSSLLEITPFSLFGFGNLYLVNNAHNYFGMDNQLNPLMHTWSLAVEEQFYFLFPIVLILFKRVRANLGFWLVSLVSLGFSFYYFLNGLETSYLATHTRIWEISLGCLLFLNESKFKTLSEKSKNILSVISLIIIGSSFFIFNKNSPMPFPSAILPVLATALLITYPSQLSRYILSGRWMVKIGHMSYTIYLVHWPVIVFFKWLGRAGNSNQRIVIFIITFGLSYLINKYIENMWQKSKRANRQILGLSFSCALVIIAFNTGVDKKLINFENIVEVPKRGTPWWKDHGVKTDFGCHASFYTDEELQDCFNYRPGKKNIIAIGDSHMANWTPMLKELASEHGFESSFVTIGGGGSIRPEKLISAKVARKSSCQKYNEFLNQFVIGKITKEDILVISMTKKYIDTINTNELRVHLEELLAPVRKVGAKVVLIDDIPHLNTYPEQCRDFWWSPMSKKCDVDVRKDLKSREELTSLLKSLKGDNILYLDPYELFCKKESKWCRPWKREKDIAYADRDHISVETSISHINFFKKIVE